MVMIRNEIKLSKIEREREREREIEIKCKKIVGYRYIIII